MKKEKKSFTPSTPTRRKWPVAELKRHLQQDSFFAPPLKAEIQRLAKDIQEHGLRSPIEISPDGTVLSGHSRWAAVKLLGWEEIPVIVRHDLGEPNSSEAIAHLVNENYNRRQLSPLEKVLCAQQRVRDELAKGGRKLTEVKNSIAAEMNIELRTLNRYLEMTKAPKAVQHAFSKDLIPADLVKKIAQRPEDVQKQAVKLINRLMAKEEELGAALGEEMKTALKELVDGTRRPRLPAKGARRLVTALVEAVQELDDEAFEWIAFSHWEGRLEDLKKGQQVVERFIKRIEQTRQKDSVS